MVFFGTILSGVPFKVYYLLINIIPIFIAIGLLKRKIWSYYAFTTITVFYFFNFIFNLLMTRHEILVEAGWKLTEDKMSVFYTVQWLSILFTLVLFLWFKKYRSILKSC